MPHCAAAAGQLPFFLQGAAAEEQYPDLDDAVPSLQQQRLSQLPPKRQPKELLRHLQQAALSAGKDYSHMGGDDDMMLDQEEEEGITFDTRHVEEQHAGTPPMMPGAVKCGKAGKHIFSKQGQFTYFRAAGLPTSGLLPCCCMHQQLQISCHEQ